MKYSRHIFAHLFVAACLAPNLAMAQSDTPAAPVSCTYCDFEKGLPRDFSSMLPPSVKETLKEMEIQQNKSSKSNDDKVASFSFVLGPKQDPDYMKTQIKTFLSSLSITAEVFDEEENDDIFGINLAGVSLESLPHGPFEFAYFLKNGFGLKVVEPDLAYDDPILNTSRSSLSGGKNDGRVTGNSCDDPDNKEWHLKHVKATKAWDFSEEEGKPSRGEGVVIAQIDTGYSDHYGAFTDDMWANASKKGLNMYRGETESDPKDRIISPVPGLDPGHGTLVAPHAVGRGSIDMEGVNGGKSPRGTAPKAKLYSIRAVNNPVIDPKDIGRINDAFEKIVERNLNIDVISMSLGAPWLGFRYWRAKRLIKEAIDKNIIVIAAGGQTVDESLPVVYPARFDNVIAVGGYQIADTSEKGPLYHERNMEWWWMAHAGKKLDISGPALDVCNAKVIKGDQDNIHKYQEGQGTSLATAMTGGIAALWLAHHGRDNLIDYFKEHKITLQVAFKKVLELAANKKGWGEGGKVAYDRRYGHGMIDAEAILKTPLHELTKAKAKTKVVLEEESEEAAAHTDMMNLLLETGYDEDTLKVFQENNHDLEDFVSELVYIKLKNDAPVMSSVLRAKLGQDSCQDRD